MLFDKNGIKMTEVHCHFARKLTQMNGHFIPKTYGQCVDYLLFPYLELGFH